MTAVVERHCFFCYWRPRDPQPPPHGSIPKKENQLHTDALLRKKRGGWVVDGRLFSSSSSSSFAALTVIFKCCASVSTELYTHPQAVELRYFALVTKLIETAAFFLSDWERFFL